MQRVVIATWVAVLIASAGMANAVDLNGRWSLGSSVIPNAVVQVVQTGNTLSIPWVLPFTGTIAATDANGFTSYQVSWTDGMVQAGFGGRVTVSGNVLDGRAVYYSPGSFPSAGSVYGRRCTCFDNNPTNGDGCDAACQVEPCWTCTGDPSVCSPTPDGGACEDDSPCTTGETCNAGTCGGGAPVAPPCFDIGGPWTRHVSVPDLLAVNDFPDTVTQRGTDLFIGSFVGSIDPSTGVFDVRDVNTNLFCFFDTRMGSVAADGLTYSATGASYIPDPFAPDQCYGFATSEIGDHCGNGALESVEECDDGNLQALDGCSGSCVVEPCWACAGTPSLCSPDVGASCDDGNACTASDVCQADASCGGTSFECGPCLVCDGALGCVAAPQPVCKASTVPENSLLYLKNDSSDASDRMSWRWRKGDETQPSELGDPSTDNDFALCLFDESTGTLIYRAAIPAGPSWSATATGFRYRDATAAADGVFVGSLKSGIAGKAGVLLKGKGVHLSDHAFPLPSLPLALPLRMQLQGENGLCLETRYETTGVLKNDAVRGLFKARGAP